MKKNKALQFVVKYTKYCNLRCSYCYEYNELHQKDQMQLSNIKKFFLNCKPYIEENCNHVDFIWHGGEPFLIKIKNYLKIKELQEEIFSKDITITNGTQTNLTILSQNHIHLLKNKQFFNSIGISFDVYGDQRVDINNQLKTNTVLHNMQQLIENKIPFGAICVLAKNTYPYVREIYKFYDDLKIPVRFLPIYRSAYEQQEEKHALTMSQILVAMQILLEEWSISKHATPVDPLDEYIDYAINFILHKKLKYFQQKEDEYTFIVNKDGNLWGLSETYDDEYKYGNIFDEDLKKLLNSKGRRKANQNSQQRINKFCQNCQYFGYCSGSFVANATPQQELHIFKEGCLVKTTIDYIVAFFHDKKLDKYITEKASRNTEKMLEL